MNTDFLSLKLDYTVCYNWDEQKVLDIILYQIDEDEQDREICNIEITKEVLLEILNQ